MAYIDIESIHTWIVDRTNISNLNLTGEVYKTHINSLTLLDTNTLLAYIELLKNPDNFFNHIYTLEKPLPTGYNNGYRSYHKYKSCMYIPTYISEQGANKSLEFLQWFKQNRELLFTPSKLQTELKNVWKYPFPYHLNTTWLINLNAPSIEQVEELINDLLTSRLHRIHEKLSNDLVFIKYSNNSFLSLQEDIQLYAYNKGITNAEISQVLKTYFFAIREPLIKNLKKYYVLKYNPEINIPEHFLNAQGFYQCPHCHSETFEAVESITNGNLPIIRNMVSIKDLLH